jgi:hypothetical protein
VPTATTEGIRGMLALGRIERVGAFLAIDGHGTEGCSIVDDDGRRLMVLWRDRGPVRVRPGGERT